MNRWQRENGEAVNLSPPPKNASAEFPWDGHPSAGGIKLATR